MKYIGIDGCRAGWFYIGLDEGERHSFGILDAITGLQGFLPATGQVLIDIPIGLRGRYPAERLCDRQARTVLGPRQSSVFPAPSRCALDCESYVQASEKNRECTERGLSKQTWNIMPKIREVDQFLKNQTPQRKIREMHPEVCFWALNHKQPMRYNKRINEGYDERLAVLEQYYPQSRKVVDSVQQEYRRVKVARDDIVDALVGAITASHSSALSSFPQDPETDETGLPMEIVYWLP